MPEEKDDEATGAWAEDGVVQQALRELRPRFPELLFLTDVCLCAYTTHGHCGVVEDGEIANDATLELLARVAVSHAEAGADAVCPSDMMDGRVGAVREALDDAGFDQAADRRVLGEVRVGVLRTVSRGRGLDAGLRRPGVVPDGSCERP